MIEQQQVLGSDTIPTYVRVHGKINEAFQELDSMGNWDREFVSEHMKRLKRVRGILKELLE